MSLMVSVCAVLFFPLDVLDEILDLIGSVSEGFSTYSYSQLHLQLNGKADLLTLGKTVGSPSKARGQESAPNLYVLSLFQILPYRHKTMTETRKHVCPYTGDIVSI